MCGSRKNVICARTKYIPGSFTAMSPDELTVRISGNKKSACLLILLLRIGFIIYYKFFANKNNLILVCKAQTFFNKQYLLITSIF